jgi:hypothetical protein
MAENETQICNIALRRISANPISDLVDDDSKEAVLCRTFYETARDAALLAKVVNPWSFAIKRQLLAASTDDNLTDYDYMYALPIDPYCLRSIVLLDTFSDYTEYPQYPFKVESGFLYTDLESAALKYVARVTDVSLFSESFVNALAWRLAAELIKPVEGTSPVDPWMMYNEAVREAKGVDEHGAQNPFVPPMDWVSGRFG